LAKTKKRINALKEKLEEGMEKRGEGGNKEGMYRGEVNTGKA